MKRLAFLIATICMLCEMVYAQSDLSPYLLLFDQIGADNITTCFFQDTNDDGTPELVLGYYDQQQQHFIGVYELDNGIPAERFLVLADGNVSAKNEVLDSAISVWTETGVIEFEISPIYLDGTVMLPARDFVEKMDGEIRFDNGMIHISKGRRKAVAQIGSNVLESKGEKIQYAAPPMLVSDKTYIPARMLATAFDLRVEWESDTRTVRFYDNTDNLNDLERDIKNYLKGKKGDWSVYVKNLTTDASFSINNKPLKPASVIKMFNMAALYDAVHNGHIKLSNMTAKSLNSMITASNNKASNEIVETIGGGDFQVGAKYVTEFANSIGCEATKEEHMLFDSVPTTTVRGRNLTSVEDCGLLLEKIYDKECVSAEYDTQMLELMLAQTRRSKLPAKLPKDAVIANKTGENSTVEADVGIVFSPNSDYVICIIVNNHAGERTTRSNIAEISKKVYSYING